MAYSIDTFPEGFAKGDLQNAVDAMDWGAECAPDLGFRTSPPPHPSLPGGA